MAGPFEKDAVILEGERGELRTAITRDESPGTIVPKTDGDGTINMEMSNVALEEEITETIAAKHEYSANVKTIQTWDEMIGAVIDIVG